MTSLTTLRQMLGARPGFRYRQFRTGVQSSPPSGSHVGVASGSSATRRLVSSDLARLSRSGSGGDDNRSDFWDNGWAYVPSLPLQLAVASNGYTPYVLASAATDQSDSTPVGYMTLTRSFSSVVAASTLCELHSPLPPASDDDGLPSMHALINRALKIMTRPRRVAIAGVTGQTRYDLTSYGVTRREQIGAVYAPETDSTIEPYPMDDGSWGAREDGDRLYLLLYGSPWGTGQTFWVDLSLPLSTWIAVGGTYAASTVGLVNESDEVAGDPDEIALVASYLGYDELANHDEMAERGPWAKLRDRFADMAAPLMQYRAMPEPPVRGGGNQLGDSYAYLSNRRSWIGFGGGGAGRGWP